MNDIADLNLVTVFEAVWRHRQISRAAAELNSSQPTVSNALRRLREIMDDRLFVRSGQMMMPTPLRRKLRRTGATGSLRFERARRSRLALIRQRIVEGFRCS
jgi:DNA-binding transcriptional LysR family regulator